MLHQYPIAEVVRDRRERTVDPDNWQACEGCNGSGVTCSDPYGFGRELICADCEGEGGWEGDEPTDACDYCEGPLDPVMGDCPSCDRLAPVVRIAPMKVAA